MSGVPHFEQQDLRQEGVCPQCEQVVPAPGGVLQVHCRACTTAAPVGVVLDRPDGPLRSPLLDPDQLLDRLAEIARERGGRIGETYLWETEPGLLLNCVLHHRSYRRARAALRSRTARRTRVQVAPRSVKAALSIRISERTEEDESTLRCAYCLDGFDPEERHQCGCGVLIHPECRRELRRCPTVGCRHPYTPPPPSGSGEVDDEEMPGVYPTPPAPSPSAPRWTAVVGAPLGLVAVAGVVVAMLGPSDGWGGQGWFASAATIGPLCLLVGYRYGSGWGTIPLPLFLAGALRMAPIDKAYVLKGLAVDPSVRWWSEQVLWPYAFAAALLGSLVALLVDRDADGEGAPAPCGVSVLLACIILGLWNHQDFDRAVMERQQFVHGPKKDVRRFLDDLNDVMRDDLRETAFHYARYQLNDPEVVPVLLELTWSEDLVERRAALRVLGLNQGKARGDGVVPRALQLLKWSDDAGVRFKAAWIMYRYAEAGGEAAEAVGDEERKALLEALSDEDSDVRCASVWALGHVAKPEDCSRLVPLLADRAEETQGCAVDQATEEALARLRPGSQAALQAAWDAVEPGAEPSFYIARLRRLLEEK